MTRAIELRSGVLSLDGDPLPTRFPVREAAWAGGHLVVIYDPAANPRSWGTFLNLAGLDENGREVWVADTAQTASGDCYTHLHSVDPLRANAWSGYLCTIDPATGTVTERVFTK